MTQTVKNLPVIWETWSSIPGLGKSPGGENGNPLQYSCLENSKDRGAWQATVRGVAKSRTLLRLSHTHIHTVLEAGSLKSVSLD